MDLEQQNAELAARKIRDAGGGVTFDQFDALMKNELITAPAHWATGWGLPIGERKANVAKLSVFAACQRGLVRQTPTGYEVA